MNISLSSQKRWPLFLIGLCLLLVLSLSVIAQEPVSPDAAGVDSSSVDSTNPDSTIEQIFDSLVTADSVSAKKPIKSNLGSFTQHRKQPWTETELVWNDSAHYFVDSLENGLTYVVRSGTDSITSVVFYLRNSGTSSPPLSPLYDDYLLRYLADLPETDLSGQQFPVNSDTQLKAYNYSELRYDLTNNDSDPASPLNGFECFDSYLGEFLHNYVRMFEISLRDSLDQRIVRDQMVEQQREFYHSGQNVAATRLFEEIRKDQATGVNPSAPLDFTTMADTIKPGSYLVQMLSPDNLIVAVNTGLDSVAIDSILRSELAWINDYTVDSMNSPLVVGHNPAETVVTDTSRIVAVAVGNEFSCTNDTTRINLAIASLIVKKRLRDELVERKKLASAVNSEISFTHNKGRYYFSLLSTLDNRDRALTALSLQVDKVGFDGPTQSEVNDGIKQFWYLRQESLFPPMKRVITLAGDVYLGRPVPYDPELLKLLETITIRSLRREFARYIRTDNWKTAISPPDSAQ